MSGEDRMQPAHEPRFMVPEVIQTSAMDCGPACLKSVLGGLGLEVSYDRLREACQTDVDGTSIDTMEDLINQLGLVAEQVMIPADHLLEPSAEALPAVVVTRAAGGRTHFVIAWRCVGPFVQVMDPAFGRRWMLRSRLLRELFVHEQAVPADAWREWAGTPELTRVLEARMRRLKVKRPTGEYLAPALADPSWRGLARLDAAVRSVEELAAAGAVRRGGEAGALLDLLVQEDGEGAGEKIPVSSWSVRPVRRSQTEDPQLVLSGCVLLRIRKADPNAGAEIDGEAEAGSESGSEGLPDSVAAAVGAAAIRPFRSLLAHVREDGILSPALVLVALLVATAGLVIDALIFRGLLEIGTQLPVALQRLAVVVAVVLLGAALLAFELPVATELRRLGRRLETRLRLRFLEKLPRIEDRYFQSRLPSDMAQRAHVIQLTRTLPELAGQALRMGFEIVLSGIAIALLAPSLAWLALGLAAACLFLPFLAQPILAERDLRAQTHSGALSSFYLDTFLGLVPMRVHGGERTLRREHEALLVEWARAGLGLQRLVVTVEAGLSLAAYGLVGWLLFGQVATLGGLGTTLLVAFWALRMPRRGRRLVGVARQYPAIRNRVLRLLEPLGADERPQSAPASGLGSGRNGPRAEAREERSADGAAPARAIAARLEGVRVKIGGHVVLDGVDLDLPAGRHVAVVGPSGAGKSTLLGLFLGWSRPARGRFLIDDEVVRDEDLEALRDRIAWIDPAVHLWNRSLVENLHYGNRVNGDLPFVELLDHADLRDVLERLPDGFQSRLGENGGLLSGGEGQRVRLGRALLRSDAGLVLLDEPFRGLDRPRREALLAQARAWWRGATLLFVSHDVQQTLDFDRVAVVEDGRLVEQGNPRELAETGGTRYAELLAAEDRLRRRIWSGTGWRRLWLEDGSVRERSA